jgi:hypothetical protein
MAQFVDIANKLMQLLVETYSWCEYVLNSLCVNVHGGADDEFVGNGKLQYAYTNPSTSLVTLSYYFVWWNDIVACRLKAGMSESERPFIVRQRLR